MATIHAVPGSWHEGEEQLHQLMNVPRMYNPSNLGVTPQVIRLMKSSSLLAVGTLDTEGRPWTTIIGGEPGFARSLGQSLVAVKASVDGTHDPVVSALLGPEQVLEPNRANQTGRIMSALGIHLATRDRVKLSGRKLASVLERKSDSNGVNIIEMQIVIAIQESMGNCPKYLNQKQIISSVPKPVLLSDSLPLPETSLELLAKADMFFISSSHKNLTMDTNHRGGPPGFVRVVSNNRLETILVYPEYSGNRLYQTLGNLYTTPKAGLVFPDYDTGDVLFLTGTTEILFGKDAASILPRSNLAVVLRVTATRYVQQGLAFRGVAGEPSPYNPPVRFLANERKTPDAQTKNAKAAYAKLLAKTILTPTIARFKFSMSDSEIAGRWQPGQYVAFSFEDELSHGYSHMRDDDPQSINDDFSRTFTISSRPGSDSFHNEFEITIRKVGKATNFLFNAQAGIEVPLRGFGGTFKIEQNLSENISFIAGGIGITPLLAQIADVDPARIQLLWTVNARDIGLVTDTLARNPNLARSTTIFMSSADDRPRDRYSEELEELKQSGACIIPRRILASDVQDNDGIFSKWYLCTGTPLRKALLDWLTGKDTIFEDFNY